MFSWSYGFVEESEFDEKAYKFIKEMGLKADKKDFIIKSLKLCEIYFDGKNKPFLYTPVSWEDIHEGDKELVFKDLINQVFSKKKKFKLKESDFK